MGNWLSILRTHFAEFLLLVVIAAIYLWNAGTFEIASATFEPLHLQIAREMAMYGQFLTPTLMHSPMWDLPLAMTWLIAIFFKFFHANLLIGRLPGILLSLCGILFTYQLSGKLFGNRNGAVFSALILATSWGYFQAAHIASADIAVITLLTLSGWLFYLWFEIADRPKIFSLELNYLLTLQAIVLSFLFYTVGVTGILPPLAIYTAFLAITGRTDRLFGIQWYRYLLVFMAMTVPWFLWTVLHEPKGVNMFGTLFLHPWIPFWWGQGMVQAFLNILMHFKVLIGSLFPWIIFFAASLFMLIGGHSSQRPGGRRIWQIHGEAITFLLLWFGVMGFLYLLWIPSGHLFLLAFLPPMALLTGYFFSTLLEDNRPDHLLRAATEGTVLLFMFMAVLMSIYIFQILPDDYPGHLWTMPGSPVVNKLHIVKDIVLSNPFPVWKLWLIPGPAVLLLGGIMLYLLMLEERYNAIPDTLVITFLTFLAFFGGLASPVLNRSLGKPYAFELARMSLEDTQSKHSKPILPVVFYSSQEFLSPPIAATLFFWESPASRQPVYLLHKPADFTRFIAQQIPADIVTRQPDVSPDNSHEAAAKPLLSGYKKRRGRHNKTQTEEVPPVKPVYPDHSGNTVYAVGVMTEQDYYELPAEVRSRLRIRKSDWTWSFPVLRLLPARSHEHLLDKVFHFSSLENRKATESQQVLKEVFYKRQPLQEHLFLFDVL